MTVKYENTFDSRIGKASIQTILEFEQDSFERNGGLFDLVSIYCLVTRKRSHPQSEKLLPGPGVTMLCPIGLYSLL